MVREYLLSLIFIKRRIFSKVFKQAVQNKIIRIKLDKKFIIILQIFGL